MLNPNPVSRKQMQNLDLVFIQMSPFINFIRTNFIKVSLCCFSYFLFWNCGLWIAKTNCLKFPLRLARRRPPYWIQWIRLWGWFHGFTNPDSVSENLAYTNATDFETSFRFGLIKQGLSFLLGWRISKAAMHYYIYSHIHVFRIRLGRR